MSQEKVELVRSLLPGRDVDLVTLFNDDSAGGELMQTIAPLLDPDFVSVAHFPGAEPVASPGLRGLRAGSRDGSRGSPSSTSSAPSAPPRISSTAWPRSAGRGSCSRRSSSFWGREGRTGDRRGIFEEC